ncbi:hypothetical protein [Rhodovulum sp. PH10]|uniref:hypothetical protein n=1 Tax=Rhodovulum sp. PH10 TaxID=1187851 RepID=UPI0012FB61C6|nr:hypothetical protein [Rhodovulum sp. PH10]
MRGSLLIGLSLAVLLPAAAGAQTPMTLTIKRLAVDVAAPFATPEAASKIEAAGGADSLTSGAKFGVSATPAEGKPRIAFELATISGWPQAKIGEAPKCTAVAGETLCLATPVVSTRTTTLTVHGELALPAEPSGPTRAGLRECMLGIDDGLLIGAIRLPNASLPAIKAAVEACLAAKKIDLTEQPKPGLFAKIFRWGSAEDEPTPKPDVAVGLYATAGDEPWTE